MSRVKTGKMSATVPAAYARACGVEGKAPRLRGAEQVVDVTAEQIWVEVPFTQTGDGWAVAARIGLQKNGALAISELRIFPAQASMLPGKADTARPAGLWPAEVLGATAPFPVGGITAAVLRKIRLTWILRYAETAVHETARQVTAVWGDFWGDAARAGISKGVLGQLQPPARGARGRPRVYDDALLLRAARLYVEGVGRKDTVRSVRQFVADALSVEPEQARDIVKTARDRGFLGRPSKLGKVGGLLTPKAEALIASTRRGKRRVPQGRKP